jgi:hypothetical protein
VSAGRRLVHYAAVRVLRAVRAYGFLAAGVVLVGASLLAPSSDGTPLIMAALLTIGERHRRAIVENRRVIVEHNRPAEAAYRAGYDHGYDEGWHESRASQRPVVVPLRRAE